jgi:Ribbon-helix-helix protein, copG family
MMVKTQVYLPEEELRALHRAAKRSGKSVAQLVREAIRRSCIPSTSDGPVGLWDEELRVTSVDHDSIYDRP